MEKRNKHKSMMLARRTSKETFISALGSEKRRLSKAYKTL